MALFKKPTQRKRAAKILVFGPAKKGKTHAGLMLPGNTGVYNIEDGLRGVGDDFDHWGEVEVHSPEDLTQKLDQLLKSPEDLESIDNVIMDGLTVIYAEAKREMTDAQGNLNFMELKGTWQKLTGQIMKLGLHNKNVWATAQAQKDWKRNPDGSIFKDANGKPVTDGSKADIDERLIYAFDLVLYLDIVDGVRTAEVMWSRYNTLLPPGEILQNFDVSVHLKPVLDGTAQPAETMASSKPAAQAKAPKAPKAVPVEAIVAEIEPEMSAAEIKAEVTRLAKSLKDANAEIDADLLNRARNVARGQADEAEGSAVLAELRKIEVPQAVAF